MNASTSGLIAGLKCFEQEPGSISSSPITPSSTCVEGGGSGLNDKLVNDSITTYDRPIAVAKGDTGTAKVKQVSNGIIHSCAVYNNSNVHCRGSDAIGSGV